MLQFAKNLNKYCHNHCGISIGNRCENVWGIHGSRIMGLSYH